MRGKDQHQRDERQEHIEKGDRRILDFLSPSQFAICIGQGRILPVHIAVVKGNEERRHKDDGEHDFVLVAQEHVDDIHLGDIRHEEGAAVIRAIVKAEKCQHRGRRDGADPQSHKDGKYRRKHQDGQRRLTRQYELQAHTDEIEGREDQIFVRDPAQKPTRGESQLRRSADVLHVGRIPGDDHDERADACDVLLEGGGQKSEGIQKDIAQRSLRQDRCTGEKARRHQDHHTGCEEYKDRIVLFQDQLRHDHGKDDGECDQEP